MERDVSRANKYLGAETFRIKDAETEMKWFIVIHNRRGAGISFDLVNDCIDVDKYDRSAGPLHRMFKITCEWHAEKRRCRHLIDNGDEHQRVRDISRLALQDLFFYPRR